MHDHHPNAEEEEEGTCNFFFNNFYFEHVYCTYLFCLSNYAYTCNNILNNVTTTDEKKKSWVASTQMTHWDAGASFSINNIPTFWKFCARNFLFSITLCFFLFLSVISFLFVFCFANLFSCLFSIKSVSLFSSLNSAYGRQCSQVKESSHTCNPLIQLYS